MRITSDDAYLMIIGLIRDCAVIKPDKIEIDNTLREDLGLDGISIIDLSMMVEDTFNMTISCEELHNWQTVSDVIRSVEKANS